jgi:hypothetical protein
MSAVAAAFAASAAGISRGALINGGFETGDFTGYTHSGFLRASGGPTTGGPTYQTFLAAQVGAVAQADTDGVISSQTSAFDGFGVAGPAIAPAVGNFMAFITCETSAGNNTITGTSIAQVFTVPVGATTLSFNARLLNNDSTTAFVQYDDFGGLALTQGATVLAQYNLDLNPATAANGHVTANTNVGGFRNATPWLSSSFNVSALGGQAVTLTAYSVNYGGDNSVETRLLLDNIVVPEPCSFVLLAGAAVAMPARRWRRH